MKDFLGNTLAVGDTVVLIRPQYRELVKAKIIRFTAKFVFLEYTLRNDIQEIKQTPDQLVKIAE